MRWKPRYYDPNFTDKETKVQEYQVIWVKLHSELWQELETCILNPDSVLFLQYLSCCKAVSKY